MSETTFAEASDALADECEGLAASLLSMSRAVRALGSLPPEMTPGFDEEVAALMERAAGTVAGLQPVFEKVISKLNQRPGV